MHWLSIVPNPRGIKPVNAVICQYINSSRKLLFDKEQDHGVTLLRKYGTTASRENIQGRQKIKKKAVYSNVFRLYM